jgi:hypothetical protein
MTIALIQSRKVFLVEALLIAVALSSIVVVYAQVTAGNSAVAQGTVTYNLNNAEAETWNTTIASNGPNCPWYSRVEINGAGYNGPVTVTWTLQQKTEFYSWSDVPGAAISTLVTLSGNVQNVYATNDGVYSSSNYDWGQHVTQSGTYRIVASIMS